MLPSTRTGRHLAFLLTELASSTIAPRPAIAAPRFDTAGGPAFGEQAKYIRDSTRPPSHYGFHVAAALLIPVWQSRDERVRLELGPRLSLSWYGMEGYQVGNTDRFWGWTRLADAALELRLSLALNPSRTVWFSPAVGGGIGSFFYSFDQVQYGAHCHPQASLPALALHADVALRWAFIPNAAVFVAPGLTVMRVPWGTEAAFACGDTNHADEFSYFGLASPSLSFAVDLGWQWRF